MINSIFLVITKNHCLYGRTSKDGVREGSEKRTAETRSSARQTTILRCLVSCRKQQGSILSWLGYLMEDQSLQLAPVVDPTVRAVPLVVAGVPHANVSCT